MYVFAHLQPTRLIGVGLSPGQQAQQDYATADLYWLAIGTLLIGAFVWGARKK